ncbi:MAG: serine/threonine protein kinase [Deltaproteobacteria bacterium]|nr:serine/threonine protein kinase [Deltaproteobacteria bacterium]
MDSLTPGTTLAGRFVIESVLGRGGMGEVVRARDKKLGRTVAIKFLSGARDGDDESGQARLLREARAAAGLNHPNIIQVYDVGETRDGAVYVVMELVAGRSLRAHIDADTLARGQLVQVLVESARALGSAHQRGVIHRDVKPDNVMVRDDGRAVVLDFGIAKRMPLALRPDVSGGDTQLTQPGTVVGTPSYLSPEQISGAPVTGAADQFALAATAYEALTGRLPWVNTRPMPLMGEIMMTHPPRPVGDRGDIPDALADAVLKALAKQPEDRFVDMDAFADALAPFASYTTDGRSLRSAPPKAGADVAEIHHANTLPATPPPAERAAAARPAAPSAAPAPRRRRAAVAAAAALSALAGVGLVRGPRAAPPAPLERDRGAVGCPLFETSGPAVDDGWLGAAASNLACRTLGLGLGDPRRVRLAATLLQLPRQPGLSSSDPYAASGARARSLAAARAHPWRLDGRVDTAGDRFGVTLSLRDASDRGVARGHAEGDDLGVSARAATAQVLASAADLDRPVDPAVAPWIGADRRRDLLAYAALDDATMHRSALRARPVCARLDRGEPALGGLSAIALAECHLAGVVPGAPAVVAVDRSSAARLTFTARYHMATNGQEDPRALAAALAALPRPDDPFIRGLQVEAQAELAQTSGDLERAREFALAAIEADPQSDLAWGRMVTLALGDVDPSPVLQAFAGWGPEHPSAWRWLSSDPADALPVARRRELAARGYRLAPSYVPSALAYGELLIRTGRPDAARLVAARTRADTLRPDAVATLDVLLEASEGHFERALARGVALLTRDGLSLGDQPAMLLEAVMELGSIVGRRTQVADGLADALLGLAPRVSRFGSGSTSMITVCGACSSARAAACFATADALAARANFLSRLPGNVALDQGARAFARGDLRAATAAWRTLARSAGGVFRMARPLMAEAFDGAGDAALAQVVDEALAAEAPAWSGATLAHARLARRALAAGDAATAHRWGDVLLREWVTAEGVDRVLSDTRAALDAGLRPAR